MWIDRFAEPLIQDRARTRPVVVVTGARQTGKTALVQRLFPGHSYASLDLPSEAEQAERDPAGFLTRHQEPLIVDEVQDAPGLLRHVKLRVDQRRAENGRFILAGSQPLHLMKGVAESLAGRAAVVTLGGLSFAETARARPGMSVEEVLMRGGFPELQANPDIDVRGYFQSYVATYLERDLRSQLRVGSLRDFERFLRAAAIRTAQLLNRAELARDAGISPSTAGQWLSVLEASGLTGLLETWFSNRTKSLVKTPKLHFLDTGLCAFLMGIDSTGELHGSPLAGALWETMVYSEFHRLLAAGIGSWQLGYWRDRTKEADFLLHKGGRFLLADAKWTEHPADTGRLVSIRESLAAQTEAAIICRCPNPYPLSQGVSALPLSALSRFLQDQN